LDQEKSSQLLTPTELADAIREALADMAEKKGITVHVEWVDGVYDWKQWLTDAGSTIVNKGTDDERREM
jgi:hypothetical protein